MVQVHTLLKQRQHRTHGRRHHSQIWHRILKRAGAHHQIRLFLHHLNQLHAPAALRQHSGVAVRHAQHAPHGHLYAHCVQVFHARVFNVAIQLRHRNQRLAPLVGRRHRCQRALAPNLQRRRHVRKQNQIAQRHQRALNQPLAVHLRIIYFIERVGMIAGGLGQIGEHGLVLLLE